MANDTALTCPAYARGRGFHLLDTRSIPVRHMGLADQVVVAKGDVLMDNGSGALALGTDGGLTDLTFIGIAADNGGSATASANASTKLAVHLVSDQDLMWAPVEGGTIAASSVGEVFDLESEDGIDQADTGLGTRAVGFHVIAYDATNAMALGRFIRSAS